MDLSITPHKIIIEYQLFHPISRKPHNYIVNKKPFIVNDYSAIPLIGEFIMFKNEEDGDKGLHKIRSRLFTYDFDDAMQTWNVHVNIILEMIDYNTLYELSTPKRKS